MKENELQSLVKIYDKLETLIYETDYTDQEQLKEAKRQLEIIRGRIQNLIMDNEGFEWDE